jgi:hypothetical protein
MIAPALLLALTLAQQVTPGTPAPSTAPSAMDSNPKGTAVIRGRVTAADSTRPLRRARITVTGGPLWTPRTASTNVRGEYELKELPAGRYQIRVQRNGYLPTQHGQRRPTETGRPFDVADGQIVEKLDFALARAGVISGRVVDETGEAVAGVRLWTMRQEYFRGRRRLVPTGQEATSDDVGQYRILNVPPGEFLVMALLRETWHAGPNRQAFGYAPTFFPSTARAADATRVKVAVGQELSNTEIALVASPAGSISGTAVGADGTPLAGSTVSLSFEIAGPTSSMSMGVGSAAVAADGSWRLREVPPGEYRLEVSSQERGRPAARASVPIEMQGADIEGVVLSASYGGTIAGQVVTDTGEALPTSVNRLRVATETIGADARPTLFISGDDNGVVGSDGRFTFAGVQGPAVVRVLSLPRGWAVKSIDARDRNFAEEPLEIRGGETVDVRVVITNRFPQVAGRVTDARGNPADGTVLLFPADDAKWYDASVLRSARLDQAGLFKMETVRPGDYFAIALESVDSWQVSDPAFLENIRGRGTRITVREAQEEMLTLKLVK